MLTKHASLYGYIFWCAGLATPFPTPSGSLVVDVHLESCQDLPRRCTKHTLDRYTWGRGVQEVR